MNARKTKLAAGKWWTRCVRSPLHHFHYTTTTYAILFIDHEVFQKSLSRRSAVLPIRGSACSLAVLHGSCTCPIFGSSAPHEAYVPDTARSQHRAHFRGSFLLSQLDSFIAHEQHLRFGGDHEHHLERASEPNRVRPQLWLLWTASQA